MKHPGTSHPSAVNDSGIWLSGGSTHQRSGTLEYLLSAAIVISVAVSGLPFSPIVGYRAISLVMLLVVSILSLQFGRGPVLLAAAVAALAWNFLYIPPLYTFAVGHVDDVVMLIVFFAVALVTGILTGRIRERERAITARERRTAALFALTNDLSSAHSQDEVIRAAVLNLHRQFEADVVVFLGEPDGDMPPTPHADSTWNPTPGESRVAAWSYWNEKPAGRFTTYHRDAEAHYVPVSGPRYSLGVVGLRFHRAPSWPGDTESLLRNFIAQIGVAVERELLNDLNKQTSLVAESERLYRTLFNSISHELRTPLAAILGTAENLLGPEYRGDQRNAFELVAEIHHAAERLNRLVANLLDMSRLESGLILPKSDWCDLRDVVHAVLKELQTELSEHHVTVNIPDEIPLIRADFGLLQQALINILHNATMHTPPRTVITVAATASPREVVISIADAGPGIPESDLGRIFEKFFRSAGSKSGGTGLGLPIAKGFIEAHHGTVHARNQSGGGAEFTITLPVQQIPEPT